MPDKDEQLKQLGDEIVALIKSEADRIGEDLSEDLDEVKLYTAERVAHLATVVGEPGYERALLAERDNVAMKAARRSVASADELDAGFLMIVQRGIQIAATALVIAL